MQGSAVFLEQVAELAPRNGTEDVVTGVKQACAVAGGIGAAVGNQQQRLGQKLRVIVLQKMALLGDGGIAVAVAAERMADERHGTEVVNDRTQADMNHLGVGDEIAMRDVCRRKGC